MGLNTCSQGMTGRLGQRQSMSIPNSFVVMIAWVILGLCGGSFFALVFVVGTFSRKNFKFKKLWGNTYFVNIYSEYRFLLPEES